MKSNTDTVYVYLQYWKRFSKEKMEETVMKDYHGDGLYYYCWGMIKVCERLHYVNYRFKISIGNSVWYFSDKGLTDENNAGFFEYQYVNDSDVVRVPGWAEGAIGYHVFPDRFFRHQEDEKNENYATWGEIPTRHNAYGGDLAGIKDKLDYLKKMNIDVLILMPIFQAHSNHKYDTIDYFRIDPSYGNARDLKTLVRSAHENNIRVILDGVFNHIGYHSMFFRDAFEKQTKSAYWDWFMIDGESIDDENVNYQCVGDYKWMPKLNHANSAVRRYIKSVIRYWMTETNIDGWRFDVFDELPENFRREICRLAKDINPDCLLIGETWHDGFEYLRGDQTDGVMNYVLRDLLLDFFIHRTMKKNVFARRIARLLFAYPIVSQNVMYQLLGSHDTARIMTVTGKNESLMRQLLVFLFSFPGMPVIYYGDEIGLTGENDPGCRKTFDWERENTSIKEVYQKLTMIRKNEPCLRNGRFHTLRTGEGIYGFERKTGQETIYVLFNMEEDETLFHVQIKNLPKDKKAWVLPPKGVTVLKVMRKDDRMVVTQLF